MADTPERLVRKAEKQGWRVRETKSGWMLFSPDGVTKVSVHKTPSDHRWHRNTIRDLRKGGFHE
jgi:hypothetical protein